PEKGKKAGRPSRDVEEPNSGGNIDEGGGGKGKPGAGFPTGSFFAAKQRKQDEPKIQSKYKFRQVGLLVTTR
ncbi:hypothetical protein [truncated ORF], partial [Aspergillus niger]|uniref:Uncharacterized protein n=2 Tax=Aspergillus niger TaxID=5061 RepID=A0AAJ8DXZ0_ASPNG